MSEYESVYILVGLYVALPLISDQSMVHRRLSLPKSAGMGSNSPATRIRASPQMMDAIQ